MRTPTLSTKQVQGNIAAGVKMKIEEIPFGVSVPCELILTDHIDDEIIRDQYEDYLVSHQEEIPATKQTAPKTDPEIVILPDGYNGHTARFFAEPIEIDKDLVKLRCAEPGKEYMTRWARKTDLVSKPV